MTNTTQNDPPRPWYREPWPWILFGIPALTVVAGITTLIIAMNHSPSLVSSSTADPKKQTYRQMIAKERAINAQMVFREDGRLMAALTTNTATADAQISVQLYRLTAPNNAPINASVDASAASSASAPSLSLAPTDPSVKPVRPKNLAHRQSGGTQILALTLMRQADGSYLSTQPLTAEQRISDYWLEVLGEKAAWSLAGALPAQGKAFLEAQ